MRKMFTELGTPNALKHEQAFPNAGAHEIAAALVTKHHQEVKEATLDFLQRVLNYADKNNQKIRSTSLHSAVPKTFTTLRC